MPTNCHISEYSPKSVLPSKKCLLIFSILLSALAISFHADAQLRQVYEDPQETNHIYKLSFYSPSQGYIAFSRWIGFTTDSGRTFTQKYITLSNVDYGNFTDINVTIGFGINGVRAFNQDTIIVYGDYGLVPSILYSTNGGNSFKLVYHSQFSPYQLSTGITDMAFPEDHITGYAIDADRILKTTDNGLTWSVVRTDANSYFNYLEALDNSTLFAFCNNYTGSKILKTVDGGSTWQIPSLPPGNINYATFLSIDKQWVSVRNNNLKVTNLFYTSDGGANWTQKNPAAAPFSCVKMKFINDSTGYSLEDTFTVYKTTDSGRVWELLPRDNNFTYLGYSNNDLQCLGANQLWAGGGHGFLELSDNAGGAPRPGAVFTVDTTNESVTQTVRLTSYSKPQYWYQWHVNGQPAGSSPSVSYTHDLYTATDSVELIVSNGVAADTAFKYPNFLALPYPAPVVSSFSPTTGVTGGVISITGGFFKGVTGVSFGGIPASSFTVVSPTQIVATVGAGDNGYVTVTSARGMGGLGGFLSSPPPTITSFTPLSGPAGSTVTITGTQFSTVAGNNIVYFGAVRATVLSATASQLQVRVPASASYQPITVTTNNHTAYSSLSFIVTFPDPCGLSAYSFDTPINLSRFDGDNNRMVKGDLDGDGKPDLAVTQYGGVAVFRNTGGAGVLSFAPQLNLKVAPWDHDIAIGDLDGDGLSDIAITNTQDSNTVSIYMNSSTPGNLSFAAPVNYPTGGGPGSIAIGDLDGDGKADLVITDGGSNVNLFSVLRNISTKGHIAFAPKVDYPDGITVHKVCIGDIDGDGKPDLLITNFGYVSNGPGIDTVPYVIYRNTSTIGNISFASKVTLPMYSYDAEDAVLGDVDGDGRLDIAISFDMSYVIDANRNRPIAIFRNTSSPGNIAFDTAIGYAGPSPYIAGIALDDLDGDGKIDLLSTGAVHGGVALLKNTSTAGHISFSSIADLIGTNLYSGWSQALTGDFDGIGKPELLTIGSLATAVQVFRNNAGERGAWAGKDTTLCAGRPVRLGKPAAIDYTYSWRSNPLGFQSTLANPIVTLFNDTTYIVDVTDPKGCVTTDSITVKAGGPAPTETAGPDRYICYGDSVQIGCLPSGTHTYAWTAINASYTSTIANPVVSPTATTNYIMTVSTGSCTIKDTVLVGVNYRPSTNAGPDEVLCGNSAVTIGSTAVDYNTTFSWTSDPAGFSSTKSSIQVQPTVTTRYFLTASNTVCQSHDTVAVTVYPALTVDAGPERSICAGTTTILGTVAVDGYTYKWISDPYGFSSGAANPSAMPAATTHYYLFASNGICNARDTVVVTVHSNTNTVVNINALPDSTVCAGTAVVFTATPAAGIVNPSYQWQVNGINAGDNSNSFSASGLADGSRVKVILSTNDSCSIAITSNIIALHVNAVQYPAVTISGNPIVSKGQSTILTAISSQAGPYPSYQWQDSTQVHGWFPIQNATAAQFKYTPAATGDEVNCIVYSNLVCNGQGTATSAALVFTVNAPVPTGNPTGSQPRLYPNPVINSFVLDSLSLSDRWESLTIESTDGKQTMVMNIRNQTTVTVAVGGLGKGYFIAVLQKESGEKTYLKFLKL